MDIPSSCSTRSSDSTKMFSTLCVQVFSPHFGVEKYLSQSNVMGVVMNLKEFCHFTENCFSSKGSKSYLVDFTYKFVSVQFISFKADI
jgi:hypothetical protein